MADKVKRLLEREGTGISWADLTFNPWLGCQKTGSPACENCYAETFVEGRLGHMGVEWGPGKKRRRTAPGTWSKISRWQRIAAEAGVTLNVFSGSLCDIFDNAVPDGWRADLGAEIAASPNLRFMLLSKRIGNAEKMLTAMFPEGVPGNVALGLTVCNQPEADRDMPKAIKVQADLAITNLFVSAEPLMGPLDLRPWLDRPWHDDARTRGAVGLLIVGGESGSKARPVEAKWVRDLRDQAKDAGCPFHFKQWGEWVPGVGELGGYVTLADGRTMATDRRCLPGQTEGAIYHRLGVTNAGHLLDGEEHREHFE